MTGGSVGVVGTAVAHRLLEEDLKVDVGRNGILGSWNGRWILQNGDNANYHYLQSRMTNP